MFPSYFVGTSLSVVEVEKVTNSKFGGIQPEFIII